MIWLKFICLSSVVLTTIALKEALYIMNGHTGLVLDGDKDLLQMSPISTSKTQQWELICSYENVNTGKVLTVSTDKTDYIPLEQQDERPDKTDLQYFILGPNKKLFLLNGDLDVIPFSFNDEHFSAPLVTEYLNESIMLPFGYNLLYEQ